VRAVVEQARAGRRGVNWPHVYIVKEDAEPALRLAALACLLLDRAEALPSYQQFLTQLKDKVRHTAAAVVDFA
jgi:protein transport protein SEC24